MVYSKIELSRNNQPSTRKELHLYEITYKQLSLADIFQDCQNKFVNDKYQFLELLEQAINLEEIVPVSFVSHFHAATGRPRRHQLYPMLKTLLLQLIFSIPNVFLLLSTIPPISAPIFQNLPVITLSIIHFHLRNSALQDFCPTWNQDCELVPQLPIFIQISSLTE